MANSELSLAVPGSYSGWYLRGRQHRRQPFCSIWEHLDFVRIGSWKQIWSKSRTAATRDGKEVEDEEVIWPYKDSGEEWAEGEDVEGRLPAAGPESTRTFCEQPSPPFIQKEALAPRVERRCVLQIYLSEHWKWGKA